jgi:hypothetical protein
MPKPKGHVYSICPVKQPKRMIVHLTDAEEAILDDIIFATGYRRTLLFKAVLMNFYTTCDKLSLKELEKNTEKVFFECYAKPLHIFLQERKKEMNNDK